MWTFALIAAALGMVTAFFVVRPLFAGRSAAPSRDMTDAAVFRDQLAELERDLAKGVISAAEAEGARVEISRRLLKAAEHAERQARIEPAPQGLSGMVAGLALLGVPVLAGAVYLGIGSPGAQDQPLAERQVAQAPQADRPSQADMEARMAGQVPPGVTPDPDYVELVGQLEASLRDNPDEPRGLELYANALMRLERWGEAWRTHERLIAVLGETASAENYAHQAEAMVMATGGYVSPEAEKVIAKALQRDPRSLVGRYYAGLALAQNGRVTQAVAIWEGLRTDAPPDAPWLEWLDMMLAEARQMQAQPARGPSAADIAAAEQMTPEERRQMIEGMVSSLEARLTGEGGTAQEWAQLVSSYATLQRPEDARRALDLALAAVGVGPDADALLRHAARLGLIEAPAEPAGTVAPGPSAEDIAAASQMTADERMQMIEGMVQRLEDRLTGEGGTAEEWLRLINAYAQLDRKDDAARIYEIAVAELDDNIATAFLREQTLLLGVPLE